MNVRLDSVQELGKDVIEFKQDFFIGNNFTAVFSPGIVYTDNKQCEVKVYWDTGSSNSGISYSAAKTLGLKITRVKGEKVSTGNGTINKRICFANFFVYSPDNEFSFVKTNVPLVVHKSKIDDPYILLIGMDYISKGTFSTVRNKRNLKLKFTCQPYDGD